MGGLAKRFARTNEELWKGKVEGYGRASEKL